jgi:hypothetical protein
MIRKGCGRKRSWTNFNVLSRHLPGGSEEKHENFVRTAGIRADIWTPDIPNTNQKRYTLDHDVRSFTDISFSFFIHKFRTRWDVNRRIIWIWHYSASLIITLKHCSPTGAPRSKYYPRSLVTTAHPRGSVAKSWTGEASGTSQPWGWKWVVECLLQHNTQDGQKAREIMIICYYQEPG